MPETRTMDGSRGLVGPVLPEDSHVVGTAWLVDAAFSDAVANIDLDGLDYLYALVFMFVSIDCCRTDFPERVVAQHPFSSCHTK